MEAEVMAAHLLIESQAWPERAGGSRFVRTARHLAGLGTQTVLFLIDEGVDVAVGPQLGLTSVIEAGASVWADQESLAQRGISADDLVPGVVQAGLDKVTPLLFDPDVKVVWH
jgi:predicted peroxiredoxin